MKTITKEGMTVKVVNDAATANKLIDNLMKRTDKSKFAIDFETTGLDPATSEVRLTCISVTKDVAYVIDHFKCGGFEEYADDLIKVGPWYAFAVGFEGKFFEAYQEEDAPVTLWDVGHMRRSVLGGGPLTLKSQLKRDLGIEISKDLQNSGWADDELSDAQYFYGGTDAIHTRALAMKWLGEMTPEHHRGFNVINDSWRAINECQETGMCLDIGYHATLIQMWSKRLRAATLAIRKLVPESAIANLNSKKQLSDFLKSGLDEAAIEDWPKTAKTKQLQTDKNALNIKSRQAPYPLSRFLAAMMVYNRARTYLSSFGETLITKQLLSPTGYIHGRINAAQAITGRMSASQPNFQQMPNSPLVRTSFICKKGRKIIMADYSGVEIRVLAELSGDKILLHDAIYDDVHSRSAIAIFRLDEEKFMEGIKNGDPHCKMLRGKAKGFTFQLLYGAGAAALSIVLRCSIEEAEDAIAGWAARYQKAYSYRQIMFEKMMHTGFLPCVSGRTIYVNKRERAMPIAANYPIQGSAGDVMYAAMTCTHSRLVAEGMDTRLMMVVHDELLLDAPDSEAERAAVILEEEMVNGWLAMFPDSNTDNLVDAAIGISWADKK